MKGDESPGGASANPLAHHITQLAHTEILNYYRFFCKNEYDQSVYQLAFCYMQNQNYMRCINLIESHELVDSHLRFRILIAQAYVMSGQVAVAIGKLNRKMDSGEIYSLNGGTTAAEPVNALGSDNEGAPSSGFGIGSSSNQSFFNLDDFIDGQDCQNMLNRGLRSKIQNRPFFLYILTDPYCDKFDYYGNLLVNPDNMQLQHLKDD